MQPAAAQNTSTQSEQKASKHLKQNIDWQHPKTQRRNKHQLKPNKTTVNTVILVTKTNKQSVAN